MLSRTHAGLLGKLAENLNRKAVIEAYCDLLQDEDNPGWFVVKSYEPKQWLISARGWPYGADNFALPWLAGWVEIPGRVNRSNWRTLLKFVLSQYAKGKTIAAPKAFDEITADEDEDE